MKFKPASPKMSLSQAQAFWNALSFKEKMDFNSMMEKMAKGELKLKEVNVDEKERIKNIVLDHKEQPSKPAEPFYNYFRR